MMMLRRRDMIGLVALGMMLITPATVGAQQRPLVVQKLANLYGLGSFAKIEAIRYTFNAQFPGGELSHSWTWEPKTDQVSYEGKDKAGNPVKTTYQRSQIGSQPDDVKETIDPNFVNDNYWLILPFHFFWDTSATVEDAGIQKMMLGKGSGRKLVVKYPSDGGYSPGDTWDLYIGRDGRIAEMVWHRGGPKKPSMVAAAWAGYKTAGPLLVSLDHPAMADDKPIHVSFSNVAVKLVGSSTWIPAK